MSGLKHMIGRLLTMIVLADNQDVIHVEGSGVLFRGRG
jgi:hypothetical protein